MSATRENRRGWLLYRDWSYQNPPNGGSGQDIATKTRVDTVFHGTNVSNWQESIANHQNATSELRGHKSYLRFPGGYYHQWNTNPTIWSRQSGQLHLGFEGALPSASELVDSTADKRAASKFLESYIRAQTNWRGGNFMAEIGETTRLFIKPKNAFEKAFGGFIGDVTSIRSLRGIKYAKALAAAWLSFRFVAKPLCDDANDAAEALAEQLNGNKADTFPVKGSGKSASQTTVIVGWSGSTGSNGWKCDKHAITTSAVKYYGRMKAQPQTRASFQRFGVDVFDIIPAVWEAVPWSFFVDYFVNVNDVLDSMRLWNASIAWLNCALKNEVEVRYSSPYGSHKTGNTFAEGGTIGSAILRDTYVKRTAVTEVPYPGFQIRNPFTSLIRSTNIGALLALISGSRPRKVK